jgi:hypothetical protein
MKIVVRTLMLLACLAAASLHAGEAVDAHFAEPYIDIDEWRDAPVRHRYVHGGFKGTDTRFSFYFPPKAQYQGRFFQYITPVPDSEHVSQGLSGEEDRIGFALASGAYFVETNGGGREASGMPDQVADRTIGGFRANAAAARYSRVVAQQFYETDKRPWGYAFGGSGGAFRTIGGAENTRGVWDGVVPFVVGSPMAIPNVFSVRMHAMRILNDKFPQIVDALEPGGSGDMYAGLNDEEKAALREVTRMGFPPKSWFGYQTMGVHAFSVLYPGIVAADPGYFTDFWSKPGYLGHDNPASLRKARVQHVSKIKRVITAAEAERMELDIGRMPGQSKGQEGGRGSADKAWQAAMEAAAKMPVAFQLESAPPPVNFLGGDLIVRAGAATGNSVGLRAISGDIVVLGAADPAVVAQLKVGDEVQVDNSNFLAAQTYHRHQVPGADYYVWDQFRDAEGKPRYPQRPMLLGPVFAANAIGAIPTGKFDGKMIVVQSLWDREAFPWQADWYYQLVKSHLGDDTNARFRLWFVDRALHGDFSVQEHPTQTVSYLGVLQQALRDLAAWVERGVEPPATTGYRIDDGQVVVAPTAAARAGVQPVVNLSVGGGKRVDIRAGEAVEFTALVEVPPGAGTVVAAEWDMEGGGDYPLREPFDAGRAAARIELKRTYRFSKPGTYFPTLRVASQRQFDPASPFARAQNLDRVRVVVQ